MKPDELLAAARSVMADAPRSVGGDRTLAAALLVRQALEMAVDGWWERTLPAMTDLSDRAQQITMPFYADPTVAGDITWAWSRLSGICHHHAYALSPTAAELASLITTVDRVSTELARAGD